MTALPEGLGVVEVVREEVAGTRDQVKLLLFFMDAEGKPLATPPTSVNLKPKERGVAPVGFKPIEGGDPSRAGGLESAPFRESGGLVGQITMTIASKPVAVPVDIR